MRRRSSGRWCPRAKARGAADGELLALSEQQVRAARAAGRHRGQGVVWYTSQFYALFFLVITLKVDYITAYWMIGLSLIIGTPFFIVFGWLSDRIGRLKIILAGCGSRPSLTSPVRRLDPLHQPGPRSLRRKESDHGLGRSSYLQPAHLRRPVVDVLGLRPCAGLPHQVRPVIQDRRHAGRDVGDLDIAGAKVANWDAGTWQAALDAKGYRRRLTRRRSIGSWPN